VKRIQMRRVPDDRFTAGTVEYETNMLDWKEAIKQVIRRPKDPQKGAEIEEIRKGIRVLDAIEKADPVLELEDSDWEHLREKVQVMQWAFIDKRIMTFVDDILTAGENVTLNVQLEEAARDGVPSVV
jgi:hypothetical protein